MLVAQQLQYVRKSESKICRAAPELFLIYSAACIWKWSTVNLCEMQQWLFRLWHTVIITTLIVGNGIIWADMPHCQLIAQFLWVTYDRKNAFLCHVWCDHESNFVMTITNIGLLYYCIRHAALAYFCTYNYMYSLQSASSSFCE